MPLLDFELASKRMQYEGGSAGLKPSLINPGAGAHAFSSPPQLDINAGRVAFTPVQPPPVDYSTPEEVSAKAANELLKVWTTAAFEFQEREDTVTAQAVHSQIQMGYDMLLRGDGDKPGYNSSTVVGTSPEDYARIRQDYDSLMASADKLTQLTLAGVTPNARVKAANAIMDSRRMLQNNALAHRDKLVATFREKQYDVASTAFIPSAVEAARTIMSEGLLNDFSEGFASRRLAAVDTFNQEVIQPAVAALGTVYAYGPMDATPESVINSRIIQHLAMSPHEQDQEIALLLYAVNADKIVDIKERKYTLDAIQGIQERAAAAMRFEALQYDTSDRRAVEANTDFFDDLPRIILSNDPNAIEQAGLFAAQLGQQAMVKFKQYKDMFDNVRPTSAEMLAVEAEFIRLGLPVEEYYSYAQQRNVFPNGSSLQRVYQASQNNIGEAMKGVEEVTRRIVGEYIDAANEKIKSENQFLGGFGGAEEFKLRELITQKVLAMSYEAQQQYLRERKGQPFDIADYVKHMNEWRASALTDQYFVNEYDKILNPPLSIPQQYELRNQPDIANEFRNASNPFQAMAVLKPYIDKGYLKDEQLKQAAMFFINRANNPEAILAVYNGLRAEASSEQHASARTVLEIFSKIYMELQKGLWENSNIEASVRAGYEYTYPIYIRNELSKQFDFSGVSNGQ